VPGYVTIMIEFEIAPDAVIEEHSHPGTHGVYLLEGGGELLTERQAPRQFRAGQAIQFSPGIKHSFRNGPARTRGIATYAQEENKPLVSGF
jgi:quercetin dioxygenase-like cupin family protein